MILRTLQKTENEKIRFPTENDGDTTRHDQHAIPTRDTPTHRPHRERHPRTHHITRSRSAHHASYIHASTQKRGDDAREAGSGSIL